MVEEALPYQSAPGDAPGRILAEDPRARLELHPLEGLRENAHVHERRGDAAAVAIKRHKEGRVIQAGYADHWRWSMAAPQPDAPDDHRAWLAGLVSAVAHAAPEERHLPLSQAVQDDPAPLAAWQARLGTPLAAGETSGMALPPLDKPLLWALFGLAALSLLAEYLSRRLRNLP